MTNKINWTNLTFFILTPLVSILGIVWLYQRGTVPWQTWALAVFMMYATGMGITVGYHRLFSHKAYEASWIVKLVLLLFGAGSFQASARWWSAEHRDHHQFVDSDKDPYGINKGFWYAHIGWLVKRVDEQTDFKNIPDLDRDPLIRLQHNYYLPIAILMCFGFPTLVAMLWGDPWGGFIVAGFARLVFVQHCTWFINSLAHSVGHQTYTDKHTSRDHWLTALFTFGEGYHNFHHEFPTDYRNGIRHHQYDPSKWIIRLLSYVGLAKNLRRTDNVRILQARLMMDRKRAKKRWSMYVDFTEKAQEHLEQTQASIQAAYQRFLVLKAEYAQLKQDKMDSMAERVLELKAEMRKARMDFHNALAQWREMIQSPMPIQF